MLKLYGNARSRATRCLWMLEETGEPYELIQTSVRPEDLQSLAYIQLNPNARIPTLVDGDVVLWESRAKAGLDAVKQRCRARDRGSMEFLGDAGDRGLAS